MVEFKVSDCCSNIKSEFVIRYLLYLTHSRNVTDVSIPLASITRILSMIPLWI